jgi:hypothetical protein
MSTTTVMTIPAASYVDDHGSLTQLPPAGFRFRRVARPLTQEKSRLGHSPPEVADDEYESEDDDGDHRGPCLPPPVPQHCVRWRVSVYWYEGRPEFVEEEDDYDESDQFRECNEGRSYRTVLYQVSDHEA